VLNEENKNARWHLKFYIDVPPEPDFTQTSLSLHQVFLHCRLSISSKVIMTSQECKKILLINPPHTAIGSRIPKEQLPPLGLLSIGGALIDAGFDVSLLDAEFGSMSLFDIVRACRKQAPQYVMLENTSSASEHATIILETLVGRVRVCVFPRFWRDVTTTQPPS
jgi:hypothetical protein